MESSSSSSLSPSSSDIFSKSVVLSEVCDPGVTGAPLAAAPPLLEPPPPVAVAAAAPPVEAAAGVLLLVLPESVDLVLQYPLMMR